MIIQRSFWYHAQSCKQGHCSREWQKAQVQSQRASMKRAELLYSLILYFTADSTKTCLTLSGDSSSYCGTDFEQRPSVLKRWKYGPLLPLNMAQKSSKNELNIGKRRIFRPAFSSWCVNMGSNCRYKGLLQLTITLKYFMYVQTTNHGLLSDLLFNYIT